MKEKREKITKESSTSIKYTSSMRIKLRMMMLLDLIIKRFPSRNLFGLAINMRALFCLEINMRNLFCI